MKDKKNIRLLILYGMIFLLAGYFLPKEIDWSPSFSKLHSQPYGCEVLYEELETLFPGEQVLNIENSFYESRDVAIDWNSNMILIDEDLNMDSLELSVLFDYVEKGNAVLMAGFNFPQLILDTFGVDVKSEFRINDVIRGGYEGTEIEHYFNSEEVKLDSGYVMMVDASAYYFQASDSLDKCGALGWMETREKVNLLRKRIGDGQIFLHSNPYVFTNFNLLSEAGSAYVAAVMSHLPEGGVVWDEYHKRINQGKNRSMLHVVLGNPALKKAVYLSIIGILLILLFMSKRKQRIIKPVDVFSNDSKELVTTIGNMYFNTSNNKEILDKKIQLFKKDMFRMHGVRDITPKQEVVKRLADRIGIEKGDLEAKLVTIYESLTKADISDYQLKKVNQVINRITHGE
ncbi:MAG: hypothetical protein HKN68_01175 [Saprospiraceae bacterium]|nr:hypothetical protein [Saprospiraceae bacterium]